MPNHDLRKELEHLLQHRKEAFADRKLTPHEALHLMGDVCRVIEPVVDQIGGDDAAFDDLVEDVEHIVRTQIIPWDIPFLNNFVEKFIDAQLPSAVRPLLELIRVRPDVPTPPATPA